eukprot:symbB.v1.2.003857.t1/scaffold213.1/size264521/12
MGPTQLSPGQALDGRTATLQAKKVIELKQMLRDRGLKVSGRKDELVHRLLAEPKLPEPKPWPPKPWPKPRQMPEAKARVESIDAQ